MSEQRGQPVVVVDRSEGGLAGFLLGLAVGAGVALLFAPRTGDETRQQLKNTGRRLRAAAAERAEDLQEALSGRYERTRDRIEEGLESARNTLDEKRESARDAIHAGKEAVKSARSELERRLAESKASKSGARDGDDGEPAEDEG
jgi:gas vesicle protein